MVLLFGGPRNVITVPAVQCGVLVSTVRNLSVLLCLSHLSSSVSVPQQTQSRPGMWCGYCHGGRASLCCSDCRIPQKYKSDRLSPRPNCSQVPLTLLLDQNVTVVCKLQRLSTSDITPTLPGAPSPPHSQPLPHTLRAVSSVIASSSQFLTSLDVSSLPF